MLTDLYTTNDFKKWMVELGLSENVIKDRLLLTKQVYERIEDIFEIDCMTESLKVYTANLYVYFYYKIIPITVENFYVDTGDFAECAAEHEGRILEIAEVINNSGEDLKEIVFKIEQILQEELTEDIRMFDEIEIVPPKEEEKEYATRLLNSINKKNAEV